MLCDLTSVLCTDIDECMENIHNCHHNATCLNTDGGYNCSCNPGYTMDGINCTSEYTILNSKVKRKFDVLRCNRGK